MDSWAASKAKRFLPAAQPIPFWHTIAVVKTWALALAAIILTGCSIGSLTSDADVTEFLRMYNDAGRRLYTISSEANWRASTDATAQNTGERIGAESAWAAFRGSTYVIETSQALLDSRSSLTDLEFRQLDKILLLAAESPGTAPEIVQKRVTAEASVGATLRAYSYCREMRGQRCVETIRLNEIDSVLLNSRNLSERRRVWEASKEIGKLLKPGLSELRDLRNQLARELGYSSYFHLQVADYGWSVDELMEFTERMVNDVRPLYDEAYRYAAKRLAERYGEPVPGRIPAHWLPDKFGEQWPGLATPENLDVLLEDKTAEWIVRQAESFYMSLGMGSLPESFWQRSDLYQLPPGSTQRKNISARSWHIDRDMDVRSLMSVTPSLRWFEISHHELGHVYYFLSYSNPDVPFVLREGLNRAFHEAIGSLIGMAARQESYLRHLELLPEDRQIDREQLLLAEALEGGVIHLPWSAGVVTQFEHDLYEKELPTRRFNRRWWELVGKYQGIVPPAPRGEDFCDACTKTHIIEKPAQYYDYAIAELIKYQLHDYISRQILGQDPHEANYYGNRKVGEWLMEIMELGATRDWREVLREKTGEDLSSRAMLEYFEPLREYLKAANEAEE
jgi:peptidyl-dipeptidase A